MKKPKQYTLAEVTQKDRAATIVWFALTRMADRAHRYDLNISREAIADEAGITTSDLKNISHALSVLKEAGWISVVYGRDTTPGKSLTITLRLSAVNLYTGMLHNPDTSSQFVATAHYYDTDKPLPTNRLPPRLMPTRPEVLDMEPCDDTAANLDLQYLVQQAHRTLGEKYQAICQQPKKEDTFCFLARINAWISDLRTLESKLNDRLGIPSNAPPTPPQQRRSGPGEYRLLVMAEVRTRNEVPTAACRKGQLRLWFEDEGVRAQPDNETSGEWRVEYPNWFTTA